MITRLATEIAAAKTEPSSELTAIDLFAGAGGATQGLRDAGFRVIAAAENDSAAAESYSLNHPGVVLEGDVRDVNPGRLGYFLGLRTGDLDLLKACPPCQGFSTLARGQVDEDRNDLVLDVSRFVEAWRPKVLLLENVPGLGRDTRLSSLLDDLRGLGYCSAIYKVDARDFGVPQRRRRLIVFSSRLHQALPDDVRQLLPDDFDTSPRTAADALHWLERVRMPNDPLDWFRQSRPSVRARIAAVPINGTRFDLPPEHQLDCHRKLTDGGKTRGSQATSSYGRVRLEEAAPTMTTRCTTPSCGAFVHPTMNRGLTLREAATFQTFPASYGFAGGYDAIERQIGNAVPVRLAYALGLAARSLLHDMADWPSTHSFAR